MRVWLLIAVCLLSANSPLQASFDEVVRYEMKDRWLPLLQDVELSQRFQAMQALLHFPQWSHPIVREALNDPQYQSVHPTLAYLLSVIGTPDDMPYLLQKNATRVEFPRARYLGRAAERLFWRYRRSNSRQFIISRLRYQPSSDANAAGTLSYKIANPDNEDRLIRSDFNVWRAQPVNAHVARWHWVKAGRSIEVQQPLQLTSTSTNKLVRLDFKVYEVGTPTHSAHLKITFSLR